MGLLIAYLQKYLYTSPKKSISQIFNNNRQKELMKTTVYLYGL